MLFLLANWFVVAKLNVLEDVPDYVSWIYLALFFFCFFVWEYFRNKNIQNNQIRKSGLNCQQIIQADCATHRRLTPALADVCNEREHEQE
jgi:hypothetical protein